VPGTVRIGDHTPKGYKRDQFREVFDRYLSGDPLTTDEIKRHHATGTGAVCENADFQNTTEAVGGVSTT